MLKVMIGIVLFFLGILTAFSQSRNIQIIDSEEQKGMPFVSIQVGELELVSNEEGVFKLTEAQIQENSVVKISFIGYETQEITPDLIEKQNNIIILRRISYEINEIYVTNTRPDPLEIMEKVNQRLATNYQQENYSYTAFIRDTERFMPQKLELKVSQATSLSKSERKNMNAKINNYISEVLKKPTEEYHDWLFDFHKNIKDKKVQYKIQTQKAIHLKDPNKSMGLEGLKDQTLQMFYRLIDTTKFYRVKSGLFGSRDTISFNRSNNKDLKRDTKEKETGKEKVIALLSKNLPQTRDYVKNTTLYYYSLDEITYWEDNLVYVIGFKPKKSKAKYEGKLYVNQADYALLKIDYHLAKGKKIDGINLKLILGIKFLENVHQGTIIYKKNASDQAYHLHYSLEDEGSYYYINRPVKFIELTRGSKEKVGFDFKIEGQTFNREEYLNILIENSSDSKFQAVKENSKIETTLDHYDSKIWDNRQGIEPLEAMKRFRATP